MHYELWMTKYISLDSLVILFNVMEDMWNVFDRSIHFINFVYFIKCMQYYYPKCIHVVHISLLQKKGFISLTQFTRKVN
jgi:hypothetical protein